MKVLITGAHFTPAQAVITELKKDPSNQVIYVGRNHTLEGDKTLSVESQVLPKLGVKFIPITTGRLRRYFSLGTFLSLLKIPIGFIQAFYILIFNRPDVVLSFGGYVAVPVVICAWFLSIPILVHEQTLVSGFANQISNFFADKIAVTFDTDYGFDKDKLVVTGNPLREEIVGNRQKLSGELENFFKKNEDLSLIFITGGNQGSHIINQRVGNILTKLTQKSAVIHQTGDSKYNDFESLISKAKDLKNSERYFVQKFFSVGDIAAIFKKASLVVSRGGANTLLELAYIGVPTIIVPIPFLYKNEQVVNATFFSKHGLGEMLLQKDLNENSLIRLIDKMMEENKEYKKRAKEAKTVVIKDAAKRLVLELMLFSRKDV